MNRNLIILIGLVLGQLAIAYIFKMTPQLVDWAWQVRLAVAAGFYLGFGAIASVWFRSSAWRRIALVAVSAALPSVLAELISWSDPAYPHLGYLVAIITAVVASIGASITLAIVSSQSPERTVR